MALIRFRYSDSFVQIIRYAVGVAVYSPEEGLYLNVATSNGLQNYFLCSLLNLTEKKIMYPNISVVLGYKP